MTNILTLSWSSTDTSLIPPLSVNTEQTLTPAGPQCLTLRKVYTFDIRVWRSPLGDEIYKLWGETVGRQLWRRLVHHLFKLLERGAPWFVGEFQNGQLNLGDRERLIEQGWYTLELKFKKACAMFANARWVILTIITIVFGNMDYQ